MRMMLRCAGSVRALRLSAGMIVLAAVGLPAGATAAITTPPVPTPHRAQGLAAARADRPDPAIPQHSAINAATLPIGAWTPLGPTAIGPSFLFGGGIYGGVNSGRITGVA